MELPSDGVPNPRRAETHCLLVWVSRFPRPLVTLAELCGNGDNATVCACELGIDSPRVETVDRSQGTTGTFRRRLASCECAPWFACLCGSSVRTCNRHRTRFVTDRTYPHCFLEQLRPRKLQHDGMCGNTAVGVQTIIWRIVARHLLDSDALG